MATESDHRAILEEDLDAFRNAEISLTRELRAPSGTRSCEQVGWWMHRLGQALGSIRTNARSLRRERVSDPLLDRAGSAEATLKALRKKVAKTCVKAT